MTTKVLELVHSNFDIPEEVFEEYDDFHSAYTMGNCWELAHEIWKVSGWPPILVSDWEFDPWDEMWIWNIGSWHVLNLYGDKYVDITGAMTQDEVCMTYGYAEEFARIDPDLLYRGNEQRFHVGEVTKSIARFIVEHVKETENAS